MGQIKWYKRDPSEALNGMMELTLEERGAFNTVLDLIYSRDGNLPDDDRFIAGWLRVDVRVWKRIKATLFERGKLFEHDGLIRNGRADVEILAALSRVGSARDAGKASAASKAYKKKSKAKKNKGNNSTTVATGVSTVVPTNHNHNQKEPKGSSPYSPPNHVVGVGWPDIPEWVPVEPWNGFIEMRRRKRADPTPRAVSMLLAKLDELRGDGHDPGRVLDQSTLKNWTDVFPIKEQNDERSNSKRSGDTRDGFLRAIDGELGIGKAQAATR